MARKRSYRSGRALSKEVEALKRFATASWLERVQSEHDNEPGKGKRLPSPPKRRRSEAPDVGDVTENPVVASSSTAATGPPQPEPAQPQRADDHQVWDRLFGDLVERAWARVRSLFVPTVSVVAVCDLIGLEKAEDAAKQLYDWERDRLFTLAKGLGAAAIGVVTTLLVDAAESKVTSTTLASMAAALVALLLLWGGFILTGLRRLAEEYPVALMLLRAGKS